MIYSIQYQLMDPLISSENKVYMGMKSDRQTSRLDGQANYLFVGVHFSTVGVQCQLDGFLLHL